MVPGESGTRNSGVRPRGAYVRTRPSTRRGSRPRRSKRSFALLLRPFLQSRPALVVPPGDHRIVSMDRLPPRPVHGPADPPQQAAHRGRMVTDVEVAPDSASRPAGRSRPSQRSRGIRRSVAAAVAIRPVASGSASAARPASVVGAAPQPPVVAPPLHPLAHRLFGDADGTRDRALGPALLFHFPSPQPPPFAPIVRLRPPRRGHACDDADRVSPVG